MAVDSQHISSYEIIKARVNKNLKELNLEDDLDNEIHYSHTFIGVSDKKISKELLEKILEIEIEKVEMIQE